MTDGGDSTSPQTAQSPSAVQQAVQAQSPQPANQVQMQAAIPAVAPPSDFVLLNDEPNGAERDPLGFEDVAGDLADTILRSRASSPLTLGIEGGWGSGKSTLMRKLARRLDRDPGVTIVWFNAWAAEGNSALEGLIKTVLQEISPRTVRQAARQERVLTAGRAGSMMLGRALGLSRVVDVVWEQVSKDARARNNLRDLLHRAMQQWAAKRLRRGLDPLMVVFVDDLDRASPDQIFEVLEAVKLYLDTQGLAFVVGYDQSVISEVVLAEKKYSAHVTGRQYLEKIVQVAYRINSPDDDHAMALAQAYAAESGTSELFDEAALRLMIDRNQRNPRRIKRFLNSFVLLYGLDADWHQLGPRCLLDVLLLDTHFPEFMALFRAGTDADPVGEFLEYSKRVAQIRGDERSSAKVDERVREVERSLPEVYPELIRNGEFVKLVQSLDATEQWGQIKAKLQRRGSPALRVLSKADEDGWDLPREKAGRAPSPWSGAVRFAPPHAGKLLWIDDAHGSMRDGDEAGHVLSKLVAEGWEFIGVVPEGADLLLKRGEPVDVVVLNESAVANVDAAYERLSDLRRDGLFMGPMVVFTRRLTPEKRAQVAELGATVTNEPGELGRSLHRLAQSGFVIDTRSSDLVRLREDDIARLREMSARLSDLATKDSEMRQWYASELSEVSRLLWNRGQWPEAADSCRRVIELYRQLADDAEREHRQASIVADHRRQQMDTMVRLAAYLDRMGDAEEVEVMRRQAEVVASQVAEADTNAHHQQPRPT